MAYHAQYMSHTPRATINETYENLRLFRQKTLTKRKEKEKRKKTMTIAELFALQANAIIMVTITELKNLEKIGSVENNLLCLPHIS